MNFAIQAVQVWNQTMPVPHKRLWDGSADNREAGDSGLVVGVGRREEVLSPLLPLWLGCVSW